MTFPADPRQRYDRTVCRLFVTDIIELCVAVTDIIELNDAVTDITELKVAVTDIIEHNVHCYPYGQNCY